MSNFADNLLLQLKKIDDSLGDIRLSSAVYNTNANRLEITCVSDVAINSDGVDFLINSFKKQLPSGLDITIDCKKSICDKQIAKNAIFKYVNDNCFAVSHLIDESNIKVLSAEKKVTYEISLTNEIADFFVRTSVMQEMEEFLSRQFSNDFEGRILNVVKEEKSQNFEIETVSDASLESLTTRFLKVNNVLKYCDDKLYDMATYIADGENTLGTVYFAGIVVSKEERQSKNGNTYYTLTLDDKSGKISGKFFTRDKNKLKKIEKVEVGSIIIIRGENELFNDRPSLMIKGFHFCEFPENFKVIEKPSKPIPNKYTLVFPKPTEVTKQDNFFTEEFQYPEEVTNTVFTVVDIESTGTDVLNDKVTEIGAVKIVNGKIVEEFQTLINPEVHISERIVQLTGIDDDLVKFSPTIDKVFPDFMRFLGDSVFVAHNADFDYRFLKNAGKALGYLIKNDCVDTLALSRKVLPQLSHHKLNNVCDYYGIVFHHHRALSDAFATAEMFLELKKTQSQQTVNK